MSWARDSVCEDALLVEPIATSLQALPNLRKYIVELVQTPGVSNYVRTLLERTLVKEKIQILELTEELRKQHDIPSNTRAFAVMNPLPAYQVKDLALTDNQQFSKKNLNPLFDYLPGIATPDEASPQGLMSLMHELAHVRFAAFMNKHYQEICLRLPSSLVRFYDGRCFINDQLLELLNEKFAYETQYRMLRSVRFTFEQDLEKTIPPVAIKSPRRLSSELGYNIAVRYNISNPEVVYLSSAPLSEILIGGDRVQLVDEAFMLAKGSEGPFPDMPEFSAALNLVIFFREARGFKRVLNTKISEIHETFQDLLKNRRGRTSFRRILANAHEYVSIYPEAKPVLDAVLNEPNFKKILIELKKRR